MRMQRPSPSSSQLTRHNMLGQVSPIPFLVEYSYNRSYFWLPNSVSALLSEDIQTETLADYLRKTKAKVEEYATDLASTLMSLCLFHSVVSLNAL